MPHCADSSYKHTEKAEIWEQRHNIWFSTTGMVSLKENGNKTHFTWEAWNISHKQRKMFCHNRLLCSAYHCQSCTNPTALSQVYFLITNSQIFFLSEQQRMLAVSVQCRPSLLSSLLRCYQVLTFIKSTLPLEPQPQLESQAAGRRKGREVTD